MSDPRYTVAAIRPLVAHARPTGRHLVVTFRCPRSGKQVQARWSAPASSGLAQQVSSRAKQTAWTEARRQVNSLLRSVLGSGAMGRLATDVANTAMSAATVSSGGPATLTAAEQETGLVEAFRTVDAQFAWDGRAWLHRSVATARASELDQRLEAQPLSRFDRLLTARMLVQVATAHRGLSDEERSYLAEAIDPDLGSLQALTARPPLTRAELAEATPGEARVSMLGLAWTLALIDEHGAPEELALLEDLGAGLGLSPDDRRRARDTARAWILDQALERALAFGHDQHARDEVIALGERLGLTREQVELAEARFQKRRA